MRFALVDNNKVEALKGATGICPNCGSELTAKCGRVRIHHWAHKKDSNCDPWWETETEWHRSWKNNYPDEWQEVPLPDKETGERHIADVRTNYGLVIEFQHSHIDPEERTSREHFYQNMVWIVDGTRLKRDYPRFLSAKNDLRRTKKQGHFIVDFPDKCFPSAWLESSVPVIFDFLGLESIDDPHDLRKYLYCLFPKQNKKEALLVIMTRESFIINTLKGKWFNKQQEPQKNVSNQLQNRMVRTKRESSHYYDPGKRRIVKKRRF